MVEPPRKPAIVHWSIWSRYGIDQGAACATGSVDWKNCDIAMRNSLRSCLMAAMSAMFTDSGLTSIRYW